MLRVNCLCGHQIQGNSEEELFRKVRDHVDDKHKEDNYSDAQVRAYIDSNVIRPQ